MQCIYIFCNFAFASASSNPFRFEPQLLNHVYISQPKANHSTRAIQQSNDLNICKTKKHKKSAFSVGWLVGWFIGFVGGMMQFKKKRKKLNWFGGV